MSGVTGAESTQMQAIDLMCSFDGDTVWQFFGWVRGAALRTLRELKSSFTHIEDEIGGVEAIVVHLFDFRKSI